MADGSKLVIYAALAGNSAIAVTKFFAAAVSGSSAMLSESVHSVVDTGNQGLLLLGIARSKRPPDAEHPFGHGMEVYFWAFVVAILIFGLGAGISLYEGVQHLLRPEPIESFAINYAVLALAMVFESASWLVALREFNRMRGRRAILEEIRRSKDPTTFAVLFEDSAAMLGLVLALLGLLGTQFLELAWADGAASIAIAVVLALAAAGLARETKSLLTGEAADPATVAEIRRLALAEPTVAAVAELRTVHFGPNRILAALAVDFRDGTGLDAVEATVARLEGAIRACNPDVAHVFIEADARRPAAMPAGPE